MTIPISGSQFPFGPCELPVRCSECGTIITEENVNEVECVPLCGACEVCGTGKCPSCGKHWHCGYCITGESNMGCFHEEKEMGNTKGLIVKNIGFVMLLCIPELWTNKDAEEFAEKGVPSGAGIDWHVSDDESRVSCPEVPGRVHVVVHLTKETQS